MAKHAVFFFTTEVIAPKDQIEALSDLVVKDDDFKNDLSDLIAKAIRETVQEHTGKQIECKVRLSEDPRERIHGIFGNMKERLEENQLSWDEWLKKRGMLSDDE